MSTAFVRPETPDADPSWHGSDPTDPSPDRWDDPHPSIRYVREVAPVNETPIGVWRLFRYDDCVRMLRDTPCGVRASSGEPVGTSMGGGGGFMLGQDPPDHTRLRKLVSKAFTPRSTESLRPRVEEMVDACLARALEAGEMDAIAELALPVPSTVICEMMGVPLADRERFTDWTGETTHLLRGDFLQGGERARAEASVEKLAAYFRELIADRRENLGDDLLSVLIRAEEEGDRLSPDELLVQSMGLLVAGFETTIGLIGNGLTALARHPAEQAKLRARPGLIESAVEECLRFEGPIGMTTRVLHADAEFGGRVIPKDTTVWVSIWGANRDPARFPDPDRFDVERTDNAHLAFGGGTHHCLGAHLARMETQVALGTLVQRTRSLELATDRIEWGRSLFRVPARLPVKLRAA